MLTSDLYLWDALNFFQITQMLLFPTDQIAKLFTLSEEYRAYNYPTYYIKSNEVFFAVSWIVFHCACHQTIDRWIVLDMDRYYTMAWYPALLNQENSIVQAVLGTVSSELTLINWNNASEWQWSAVHCLTNTDQIETSEWGRSGYSVQCASRVYFSEIVKISNLIRKEKH